MVLLLQPLHQVVLWSSADESDEDDVGFTSSENELRLAARRMLQQAACCPDRRLTFPDLLAPPPIAVSTPEGGVLGC